MDVAVSLVEAYLRSNGYLTLSELPVFRRASTGEYLTVTDVDVVGLRLPGDVDAPIQDDDHPELLLMNDPVLQLRPDLIDLVIGEVKQGEARLNKALRSHEAIHSVLHRVRWLFPPGQVDAALEVLTSGAKRFEVETHSGATLRVRLIAFGQSDHGSDLHLITHAHILKVGTAWLRDNHEIVRSAKFNSPAASFLELLVKTRHEVVERPSDD